MRASDGCVRSGQGIVGIDRMVECDGGPVCSGMTGVARSGECGGDVIGVCSPCKVCLVAAVAGCRQCCVVVVGVALRTRDGSMRTGQRKCGGVIKRG